MLRLLTLVICIQLSYSNSMMDIASLGANIAQIAKQSNDLKQQQNEATAAIAKQERDQNQQVEQVIRQEQQQQAAKEKAGYPILDPFAKQSYWALRDTQFKQSMAIAAKRSQLETKATKEAIDQEFQSTQAMVKAVGGLMQTAGSQLEKIGKESEKKKAEQQAGEQAGKDAKAKESGNVGVCPEAVGSDKTCRSVAATKAPGEEGVAPKLECPKGHTLSGDNCYQAMSSQEVKNMDTYLANQQATTMPQGCNTVPAGEGGALKIQCADGKTYDDIASARAGIASNNKEQKNIEAEIRDLSIDLETQISLLNHYKETDAECKSDACGKALSEASRLNASIKKKGGSGMTIPFLQQNSSGQNAATGG